MATYAKKTKTSPEQTQTEIKRLLQKHGADEFGSAETREKASVYFRVKGLCVRMDVPLGKDFKDQQLRQRWRALLLAIKAKLVVVECGISTLETEFMPFVVMPDGRTVSQHLLPKLEEAVKSGQMPKLLMSN